MKALVTGAGGFIGSHIASALLERGYKVRGLFYFGEDTRGLEKKGIEAVFGDLTDPGTIGGVADGIDIVFHLATRTLDWGTKKQFESIMVGGTANLLAECKGKTGRFVYFSSVAAMGLGRDLAGVNEDEKRITCGIPYCDTKIDAEDLVSDFCSSNDMEYTIVRPSNVTGPGSVWVTEVIDAFLRGPVPLINGGRAPGAFIYVENLVDGAIAAAESPKASGRTYFFRDDYDITWKEYLKRLGALVGKHPGPSIPFGLAWRLGSLCETIFTPLGIRPPVTRLAAGVMGKDLSVDCIRAKTELGYKTKVSQESAMQTIENWVVSVYLPSKEFK